MWYSAICGSRAPIIGAQAKKAYDGLFMESSTAADKEPFVSLFYCHEYTRECYGRGLASPVEIPRLKDFWAAAFAADKELADKRAAGSPVISRAQGFIDTLNALQLDKITFSDDPQQDANLRATYKTLIDTLTKICSGSSIHDLMVDQFQGKVRDALLNPGGVNATLGNTLNIAKQYEDLVGVYWLSDAQSWIAANDWVTTKVADYLVDEMVTDLGNALDAQCIIGGGTATGANGEKVKVTFSKISK